jgi:DNA mismatch repair ATPase MutS
MGKFISFDLSTNPQKLLQNLFTLFTIAQSMYQPIQNAFHLHTINSTIVNLGSKVVEYFNYIKLLQEYTNIFIVKLPYIEIYDVRRNFFNILENPSYLKHVFERVSYYEILYRISQLNDFTKVNLYKSKTPYFEAESIYDIHLNNESRIGSPFSIKDTKNHYLLSGPNGGGKSSFLRAVLQTVLLSQTFGYSCGTNVKMSPFDVIFSGLHIQDIPGSKSLFEKEICFARDVLYNNNPEYKCFVLFDEIFHSTNPPDSIKTSNKFLNKLWLYNHFASIVSTHVFEIIEQSPEFVNKICVDSTRENGVLQHTYKMKEGVNTESSVEMIWNKEFDAVS